MYKFLIPKLLKIIKNKQNKIYSNDTVQNTRKRVKTILRENKVTCQKMLEGI